MTRLSAATIRASEYTGHAIAVTSASTPRSTMTYPSSGTRPRSACPAAEMSSGTVRPTQLACRTEWVPSTMLMYSAVPAWPSTLRYADSPVSATSFSITGLARSTSDSLDSACAPSWMRRLPGRYVPPTLPCVTNPVVSSVRRSRSAVLGARSHSLALSARFAPPRSQMVASRASARSTVRVDGSATVTSSRRDGIYEAFVAINSPSIATE